MSMFVESVGLYAPGMESWAGAKPVLQDQTAYQAEPLQNISRNYCPPMSDAGRAPL